MKRAIETFQPRSGFELFPPSPSEKSFIHDWGVRVKFDDGVKSHMAWICLAQEPCRSNGNSVHSMSANRTSRPTEHLREHHGITSSKTESEVIQRRRREEVEQHLEYSSLFRNDGKRFNLLLNALNIVNNNLAIQSVEHDEYRLVQKMTVKEEMKTTLNRQTIKNAIVELYTSAKQEVSAYLASNCGPNPTLTMMVDFWTCKTKSSKFLGMRVYLIDQDWTFKSVLLGTRKFNPLFGDRDAGIQRPFMACIDSLLDDFGLTPANFYGAISDAGADVRCMMVSGLDLQWEWCTAHMVHAATKAACGMNEAAHNPRVAALIARVKKVINQVRTVEKVGDLFEALCRSSTEGKAVKLVDCNAIRFLSTTKAIERVVQKWPALVKWYAAREAQATRERKPPPDFILANDYTRLTHILAVLKDMDIIKTMCQAEDVNQVEVLVSLFRVRIDVLDPAKALPAHDSTRENPKWIQPSELDEDAASLRLLLRVALDERFFKRYYHRPKMREASFVFEMQMRLHPTFKDPGPSLNATIRLTGRQTGRLDGKSANDNVKKVSDIIDGKLFDLMKLWAELPVNSNNDDEALIAQYSDDLTARFAPRVHASSAQNRVRSRIEEELSRWSIDTSQLRRVAGVKENVLAFWKRMEATGEYRILPKVVRVLFAVPASSAQIERDFSVSGAMVTSQRTSLSRQMIDMCSFVSRNREFVDISQCEAIPTGEHAEYRPRAVILSMDGDDDDQSDIELD